MIGDHWGSGKKEKMSQLVHCGGCGWVRVTTITTAEQGGQVHVRNRPPSGAGKRLSIHARMQARRERERERESLKVRWENGGEGASVWGEGSGTWIYTMHAAAEQERRVYLCRSRQLGVDLVDWPCFSRSGAGQQRGEAVSPKLALCSLQPPFARSLSARQGRCRHDDLAPIGRFSMQVPPVALLVPSGG